MSGENDRPITDTDQGQLDGARPKFNINDVRQGMRIAAALISTDLVVEQGALSVYARDALISAARKINEAADKLQ